MYLPCKAEYVEGHGSPIVSENVFDSSSALLTFSVFSAKSISHVLLGGVKGNEKLKEKKYIYKLCHDPSVFTTISSLTLWPQRCGGRGEDPLEKLGGF